MSSNHGGVSGSLTKRLFQHEQIEPYMRPAILAACRLGGALSSNALSLPARNYVFVGLFFGAGSAKASRSAVFPEALSTRTFARLTDSPGRNRCNSRVTARTLGCFAGFGARRALAAVPLGHDTGRGSGRSSHIPFWQKIGVFGAIFVGGVAWKASRWGLRPLFCRHRLIWRQFVECLF